MQVILLEDIENLGKKYDIKEVKDGYARNFLFPKNLAKLATKKELLKIEELREAERVKAEEELEGIQKIATSIDGQEVMIPVKVGEEGQLFESISPQRIIEGLQKLGFTIDKNQIEIENPIKELGEFAVKVKFEHNLESEIKVIVTEEE